MNADERRLEVVDYRSVEERASETVGGARFWVERMSFGRRLKLIRELKEWLGRLEFVAAGEKGPAREAEAALLVGEIDRIYLRWGLRSVEGLNIDGQEATLETLIDKGPEALVQEIVSAIRREAGLNEAERKNCESPSISCAGTRPDGSATTAGG